MILSLMKNYFSVVSARVLAANQSMRVSRVFYVQHYMEGLVLDCSNSSMLAMELLQAYTKPSTYNS